jgi:hypothetical protein
MFAVSVCGGRCRERLGHWEELSEESACTVKFVMMIVAKQMSINLQPTFATTVFEDYANNEIKVT